MTVTVAGYLPDRERNLPNKSDGAPEKPLSEAWLELRARRDTGAAGGNVRTRILQ